MKAYLRLISLLLLFCQLPCQADSIATDSAAIRQYNLLLQLSQFFRIYPGPWQRSPLQLSQHFLLR